MGKFMYQFPASGNFISPKERKEYTELFTQNMEDDLKDWFLFPKSDKLIDKIVFGVNEKNGDVSGISIHTNEELLGNNTQSLRDCIKKNISITGQQYYQTTNLQGKVTIERGVTTTIYETENKADDFADAVNALQALGPVLE